MDAVKNLVVGLLCISVLVGIGFGLVSISRNETASTVFIIFVGILTLLVVAIIIGAVIRAILNGVR